MENYHGAFIERSQDQEALHTQYRKIASMHMGGITIECLLKSIILAHRPSGTQEEWKTKKNNPGHSIYNPGHDLQQAVTLNPRLLNRINAFPDVINWLNKVQNPSIEFINLRYSSGHVDDSEYQDWHDSYQNLKSWLQQQSNQL